MSSEFIAAVRGLLIPLAPERERHLLELVAGHLTDLGVEQADHADWLTLELGRWRQAGRPSNQLKALIRTMIFSAQLPHQTLMFRAEAVAEDQLWAVIARRTADRYFEMHAALVGRFLLDHDFARQLLAQAGWMARLAELDRMSASEISRLVGARDDRLAQRWDVIQKILSGLGLAPSISTAQVQEAFGNDSENEPELLGDLDFAGSIALTAEAAKNLGCSGTIEDWLIDIFVKDLHDPYLLIMHYQMIILEYFDHPPTFAYEFTPRGQAVDWLAQNYRDAGIPVAGSAFLNNAKAIRRFDRGWVAGRADHARAASALAALLASLEPLGGLARKEIANRLRALLRRHMRLREQADGPLPNAIPALNEAQVMSIFAAIAEANSATTGIAEQRMVDCYGVLQHPRHDGWVPRGLGDSVFAPNLPRRKCGDCEFERATQAAPSIVAYEAHGGRLSALYVEDHLATLKEIIRRRSEDLIAVAPLENWAVRVIFVSHGVTGAVPENCEVETENGVVTAVLEYLTFEAVSNAFPADQALAEIANANFTDRLNSPFVHPRVRQRVTELMA